MSKRMKRSLSILFAVAVLVGAGLTLFALQSPVKAGGGVHENHIIFALACEDPPCNGGPSCCGPCRPTVSDSVHIDGPTCTFSGCNTSTCECEYDCPFVP